MTPSKGNLLKRLLHRLRLVPIAPVPISQRQKAGLPMFSLLLFQNYRHLMRVGTVSWLKLSDLFQITGSVIHSTGDCLASRA